ncbi:chemokine (C-C motif) ligand 34b, duplicate 4 [Betta splendens]|uniref:Chemokine (C-C motif) ligand 34b, duplicate 4 n=1 Tax=Betta splendens TaxID=158456 RepID=A0A8M1HDP6_BETSP|nr:chemokine (C-C motif) ligand 34b, duplicate 4 [Betta splendens]
MSIRILLLVCLCFQVCAANRRHPNKGIIPLCCTRVSTADISEQITGNATIQKPGGQCVKALIFPVAEGKVCVDPEANWVRTFLDKKKNS